MRERRRYVRIPERSQISYKVIAKTKIETYLTKDIGQGGLRFFINDPVPKDSLLEIELTQKGIPFSFRAIVKAKWIRKEPHSDRYEVGVEFINIPKQATEHLRDYITVFLKNRLSTKE